MGKLKELISTQDIVKEILEDYPITRNSDDYLYVLVCNKINPDVNNIPFRIVLIHRKSYNLPAFETVRRTRQKIQSVCPELCAYDDVQVKREMNEQIYKEYARGVV